VSAVDAAFIVRRGDFTLDVTAVLEPGTVVAILGPNGAGKSTLLRTLAGLQGVDDGRVLIGGREVDGPTRFVPPQER
jgi:ABC-type sugar transport system ATPase subunit